MKHYFIQDSHFGGFLSKMTASRNVIAPVAKKNKFVFDKPESPEEIRLDYDVTLLPPKKAIFPPKQDLLSFSPEGARSGIAPEPKILFGVHFYDIKAIDMLDLLFRENNEDWNYLAYREQTTIVGSSIQNVSKRAFWGSVGKDVQPKGHDAFLTKIGGGYLYETLTGKGEDLIQFGNFQAATPAQQAEAEKVNNEILARCPEKLEHTTKAIAEKVRNNFKSPVWEEMAKTCFSCGTCNIVCPTCYCFDVQDNWNLDQASGVRTRSWDGCLMEEFSKVTLGFGASENFREHRGDRFRHRVMRKATYLNEKLGGPACVGCGRCSAGCVPDIADPVAIINKIMEG